jgi:hypothetical protein
VRTSCLVSKQQSGHAVKGEQGMLSISCLTLKQQLAHAIKGEQGDSAASI